MIEPPDETAIAALEDRPWRFPWQAPFLRALCLRPNATRAAESAGITIGRAKQARRADETFRDAWAEAVQIGVGNMAAVAHMRAMSGWEKTTTRTMVETDSDGKIVKQTTVTETSLEIDNTMMRWLLARLDPDQFGDRKEHRVVGAGGGPIQHELYRPLTEERKRELAEVALEEREIAAAIDVDAEELTDP